MKRIILAALLTFVGVVGAFAQVLGSGGMVPNTPISVFIMGSSAFNTYSRQSAISITSATELTAYGVNAANSATTTNGLTAIGRNASYNVSTTNYHTGIGSNAGRCATSSTGTTFLGHGAGGQDDTTPAFCTGDYTTAIGGWAGQELTTGSGNSFGGMNSGLNITTGGSNACWGLGSCAGTADSTGTAVGNAASQNAAIGYDALQINTANDNVAAGFNALAANTSGAQGVAIGSGSGASVTTQANTVSIGYGATATVANQIMLGNASHTHTVLRGNVSLPSSGQIAFSGTTAPSNSNFALYGDGSATVLNGPSGGVINFDINNTQVAQVDGANSRFKVSYGTAATSTTTGSLVNTGGFGNGGAAWFGGTVNFAGGSTISSNNTVLAPAGTTTNPTLAFANCGTNCGILAPASGQLEVVVAGANKLDYGVSNAGDWTFGGNLVLFNPSIYIGGTSAGFGNGKAYVYSIAANILQLGASGNDVSAPTAMTIRGQSVIAGNANTAASNFTISGGLSNGTGCGDVILATTNGVAASGTQNTATTALTLKGCTQAIVTSATDAASSATGALQVAGGASVAKRFWIPAITTSAGLQTAVLCQSSGGEMIADSVACLASGSQFKNIMGPMEGGALEKLKRLPIDRWAYKQEGNFTSDDWTRERIGPIAQDVAAMDPRLAGYDKEGHLRTFSPDQLLAFTIKAVQEHAGKTDAEYAKLKADSDNLRACNDSWKCRLFGIGRE